MINSKLCYITCIFLFLSIILFCINQLKKENDKFYEIKEEIKKEEEIKNESFEIDYKAGTTINVLISATNEVVAMDINDYLRGVVPAEMPPYYDIEALKAQAIVARTYLYRKISDNAHEENIHICDNFAHCQAFYTKEKILEIWENKGYDDETRKKYWENINKAVVETSGKVIKYDGSYIKAFFHASSPDRTEDVSQIWDMTYFPYLVSVENHEDEDYPNRNSTVIVSIEEFFEKVDNVDTSAYNLNDIESLNIHISDYTTSGRVKNIEICGCKVDAEALRTYFGLKSTNFTIDLEEKNIIFNVTGYGHGVGMSQVGANFYAKNGMKCEDIIKHYYTGVYIEDEK